MEKLHGRLIDCLINMSRENMREGSVAGDGDKAAARNKSRLAPHEGARLALRPRGKIRGHHKRRWRASRTYTISARRAAMEAERCARVKPLPLYRRRSGKSCGSCGTRASGKAYRRRESNVIFLFLFPPTSTTGPSHRPHPHFSFFSFSDGH